MIYTHSLIEYAWEPPGDGGICSQPTGRALDSVLRLCRYWMAVEGPRWTHQLEVLVKRKNIFARRPIWWGAEGSLVVSVCCLWVNLTSECGLLCGSNIYSTLQGANPVARTRWEVREGLWDLGMQAFPSPQLTINLWACRVPGSGVGSQACL